MEIKDIACVLICDRDKKLFYLQQKDESYHDKKGRLGYCFFGGGIEKGETKDYAMVREINEELDEQASQLIIKNIKEFFDVRLIHDKDKIFKKIRIYVCYLDEKDLTFISRLPVKEGKRGVIFRDEDFSRNHLLTGVKEIYKLFKRI